MVKFSKDVAMNLVPYAVLSFGAFVFLLYGLVLAGSATNSPGMSNLFLVSLHKSNGTSNGTQTLGNGTSDLAGEMTVHVGYFGMCTSTASKGLSCSGTYSKDAVALSTTFLPANDFSTMTLFSLASHIQSKVFPCILVVSGVLFFLSFAVLLVLKQLVKRSMTSEKVMYRRWQMKKVFKYLVWVSVALNIAVAAGGQQASQALQWLSDVSDGNLEITSGSNLLGLQWTIVVFSTLFASGSSVIYNKRVVKPKEGMGPGIMSDKGFTELEKGGV
ncbi:Ca2+ regulator and membrane fusion protein Fig1-domain-containing protein [Amylocarpus encephaloides]|uniref:Ca2+ regulator and membrane fusion protein Fig1-domain-containing protein n=1 Tax=Amylocarpus encephaloides TaxID=45428 RepID=A0A9P7YR82_9HELO|nr:Ca2+ regulator and membrane fusion protein Fig1-domain-containing protein [Amylocarpus encephaloides]